MSPKDEARARLGARDEVMVLEPSPPAVTREPFTDDPTARGEVAAGTTLVAPIETGVHGDVTWDSLARDDADLAQWCESRALGAWGSPPALPAADAFAGTRLSFHALAEHVLCAARHRVNGKIGLRFTRGGFGTPFFGTDEQVRIEGTTLVYTAFTPARETRTEITNLGDAAAFVGIEAGAPDLFVATTPLDLDRPLDLDPDAVHALGWWYGFATAVLAQVRADPESNAGPSAPSLVQVWPEHLDVAVDLGEADAGSRANFGASPGDAEHPEPYFYVGPWDRSHLPVPVDPEAPVDGETPVEPLDPYWNEPFGASLPYSALVGSESPRDAALAFLRAGRGRLLG